MATYGMEIGIGLLAVVIGTGYLLAAKAAKSVREFRQEDFEQFLGGGEK